MNIYKLLNLCFAIKTRAAERGGGRAKGAICPGPMACGAPQKHNRNKNYIDINLKASIFKFDTPGIVLHGSVGNFICPNGHIY